MSYINFREKLAVMEEKEFVEKFLIYNTSLIIAAIKPGVTIAINKNDRKLFNLWNKFGKMYLEEIGLKYMALRESDRALIIFVYDEIILEKHINRDESLNFLQNIGYPKEYAIEDYIQCLKMRYNIYHCPHELGLFLGIPFEDVKDFIECTDKKCLLCGYWKVYNNSNNAEILFNKYDKVKQYTVNSITAGILSRDLVVNIKKLLYN